MTRRKRGRRPAKNPRKAHRVFLSDKEYARIEQAAELAAKDVPESRRTAVFMRRALLNRADAVRIRAADGGEK